MDCQSIRRLLPDFLEDELSPAEIKEIRKHILSCDGCRKELLAREKCLSRPRPDLSYHFSDDWPDRIGRRLEQGGFWASLLGPVLLPWEKKIPLLTGALVLMAVIAFALRQTSCKVPKKEPCVSPSPAAPPVAPAAPQQEVRLKKNPAGSVFILEEAPGPAAGSGEKGEEERLPAGNYDPFQDQQIRLYVKNVPASLKQAVQTALSSGGQLFNAPTKGFENIGPHERVLVFDIRSYRPFLKKLEGLGRIEHAPLARSDYVVARLTVLPLTAPPVSPAGE